jgi:hypothetical protein
MTEQEILCEIHEDNKPPAIPPINVVEPSIRDSIFKFGLLSLELIILSSLEIRYNLRITVCTRTWPNSYPINNKNIINTNIFSPRSKSI